MFGNPARILEVVCPPVTSEPAARRDFYRVKSESCGRIPEYNQPRRGVISVYPVIIVQRGNASHGAIKTTNGYPSPFLPQRFSPSNSYGKN